MGDSNDASRAPVLAALQSLPPDALLRFVARQRWFGAKGGAPAAARVQDAVVLPWGDGAFALARVVVSTASGEQTYQLPVSARANGGAETTAVMADGLFDASYDAEFRRGIVDAIARGGTIVESDGLRLVTESAADAADAIGPTATTTLGSAEQSNTSFVVGERAILKLFRLLRSGVQPDVEVTRFLTQRAAFPNTPKLLGTVAFERAGEATTAGMLQAYLPNSADTWSYALERGNAYFAAPAKKEASNRFVEDARRLGATTRALHEALAGDDDDPDFAPEPATGEDLDRWAHRTQQSIRDALALLERQLASRDFPKERMAEAKALVTRRDHYLGWVHEIDDTLGDDLGLRIRVHGDYHLGQVLHTRADDFMIIDFEGEPSRSLDERREKTSPLRDVAGMLRSFAYAAATLAMAVEKTVDPATRELRAARWERDVRAAYLAGYLATPDEEAAEILPEQETNIRQLLSLFEMEKVFYELAYELNNRPAWSWIPLRGIAKLATKA